MSFQPRNILVTGAAGFIGSNFVRYLLTPPSPLSPTKNIPFNKIVSLDKLTYAGSLDNLEGLMDHNKHQFIKGDICDKKIISEIFKKHSIDTVVHFAAESHVDNSILTPEIFLQTNILGTFNLLEQSRTSWLEEKNLNANQCRFHHISTDEVYGTLNKEDEAFKETTPYQPNSPYSASKAGSDHIVRAYQHTYKLPSTISNCSNNYGPFQHAEKFIPVIIKNCLAHKPIPIYGDGSNIRDWLFVENHCEAIAFILTQGTVSESYNIGGNFEIDNISLAKMVCNILDELTPSTQSNVQSYKSLIQFVEDRKGHDWRYAIDGNKIKQTLGWEPPTNFKELLTTTIKHYLSRGLF